MEATEGAIGFAVQKALLAAVVPVLPERAEVCLMADRFYGTADLIAWCQEQGWDYRLRLKGNLGVRDAVGRRTTGQLAKARVFALEDVQLTARQATTNIGIIHDADHAEPWIVAMPAKPGYLRPLEYSARWAIEALFADFKSRGFGRAASVARLRRRGQPDPAPGPPRPPSAGPLHGRLHRVVGRRKQPHTRRKKDLKHQPKKVARSKTSFFTRGLRCIARLILNLLPVPPLWAS